MPIWIDRSAHTRSIAAKYFSAYGASSSRCDACVEARDRRLHQRVGQRVRLHDLRPRLGLDRRRRPRRQTAHLVALAGRGVVPGQLRGDDRLVRHPVRGQRLQERPPQLLVHIEPVDLRRAVQQPLQQLQIRLRRGRRREEPRPRQLVLAARPGQPQLPQRTLRQQPPALLLNIKYGLIFIYLIFYFEIIT